MTCSVKPKETEALKTIKNRKIKELESNLNALQQETYKVKTENLSFQKTKKLEEESLQKEIIKNTELTRENKRLKSLWENLQQELEKRNQQVISLQSLNRDLSLLFNKKQNTLPEEQEEENKEDSVPPPSPSL